MNITHILRSTAAFTLLLISFASCKKSEGVNNSIVGKWEARNAHEVQTDNTTTPATVITTDTTYAPGTSSWLEFREDKTFTAKDSARGPSSNGGTYEYSNGKMIIQETGSGRKDTINLVVNGNTFTLSQNVTFASFSTQLTETFARL